MEPKFEKIDEVKKVVSDKVELEQKEEEIKKKESRLGKIPSDIKQTEEYFQDMTEREQIRLDKLKLLKTDMIPLNPTFIVENSDNWVAVRKRELENEEKIISEGIKQLELKRKDGVKGLNEQSSRIKEDLPRLKKRISELKEKLKS